MKSNRDKRSALKWLALAAIVGSMGLGGCGWNEDGVYKEFNDTFDVDSPEQFDLSNNACAQMIRDDIINDTNRFSFVTEEVKLEFNACSKHGDEHVSDDNGDTDNDETSHAPDPTEPADPPSSDDNNGGVGANKNAKFNECEEGILRGLFEKNGFCKDFAFEENGKYNFVVREVVDGSEKIICESDDSVACRYKQCPKEYTLVSDYKLDSSNEADDYACVKSTCGGVIVDLQTDSKNCGKCGSPCGDGKKCDGGVCIDAGCQRGQIMCDGKCITPEKDMTYCGARGKCDGSDAENTKGETCSGGYSCTGRKCEKGCQKTQALCGGNCVVPASDNVYCGATPGGLCTSDVKNNKDYKGQTCPSGTSCQDGVCKQGCAGGQILCDGKCVTPESDSMYCGARGKCDGSNVENSKGDKCESGYSCKEGKCEKGCQATQALCGDNCVAVASDNTYCGATPGGLCSSDTKGDKDYKGQTCESGYSCQGGECKQGCAGGQILCDGQCITPDTDSRYCGARGKCDGSNTENSKGDKCESGYSCKQGKCEKGCQATQALCDGNCVVPASDNVYCGATPGGLCSSYTKGHKDYKGEECQSGYSCQGGECKQGCAGGQILCDGQCITPNTDSMYCGARGRCDGSNTENSKGDECKSGYSCKQGKCEKGCQATQALCGGNCVVPASDNEYCGATPGGLCTSDTKGHKDYKGEKCQSGYSCQGGICKAGCVSGQVLCDGKCITPGTDMIYCGASGDCSGQNKGKTCSSGMSCQGGTCEAGCVSGQVLCDGKCITPGTDMIYCGASGDCSGRNKGTTCPSGTSCQGGTCEAGCIDGQLLCDGKCITPGTDMIYCGASGDCSGRNKGKTCPSGTSCQGGTCEAGCVSGQVLCDGKCITPGTDMIYCGASGDCTGQNKGRTCPSGTSCQGGICEAGCVSGQVLCDGKCITPGTDVMYCGAKGACNATDASSSNYKGQACVNGKVCVNGACVQNSCTGTLTLCATQAGNQCIDIKGNDVNHCGACNYKCSEHHLVNASSTSCSAGECQYACTGTYVNVGTGNTASTIYCINPEADNLYCGATGMDDKGETCSSELKCMGGKCVAP